MRSRGPGGKEWRTSSRADVGPDHGRIRGDIQWRVKSPLSWKVGDLRPPRADPPRVILFRAWLIAVPQSSFPRVGFSAGHLADELDVYFNEVAHGRPVGFVASPKWKPRTTSTKRTQSSSVHMDIAGMRPRLQASSWTKHPQNPG